MLNITYKDRNINIWVRERTQVIDIISNVRKMNWFGQDTSTDSKTTDGPRVSPLGDHNDKKGSMETSQAAERQPGQILERHDLPEDSTQHANLETAC